MFDSLALLVFPLLMIFAALADLFTMTIPNRVSLVLIAAYLLLALYLRLPLATVGLHVSCGLAMLALTSARLMAVILVLIPLVIGPILLVGRRVRRLSRAAQDRIADTSSLVDETLNAIQTVQAFTLEDLQRRRRGIEDAHHALGGGDRLVQGDQRPQAAAVQKAGFGHVEVQMGHLGCQGRDNIVTETAGVAGV